MNGIEVKKYNQEEVLQFQGDDRFDEAFCFDENSPDVLAVAAIIDHEIVGMAGASADSPYLWQIGINVNKEFEGRHIASGLVSILKRDIMEKDIVRAALRTAKKNNVTDKQWEDFIRRITKESD